MNINVWEDVSGVERESGVSMQRVQYLLTNRGGRAWTEIFAPDGTPIERRTIRLTPETIRYKRNK